MKTGVEMAAAALLDHAVVEVVVDDELLVDVEARAVVGSERERVVARALDLEPRLEAQREGVGGDQAREVDADVVDDPPLRRHERGEPSRRGASGPGSRDEEVSVRRARPVGAGALPAPRASA